MLQRILKALFLGAFLLVNPAALLTPPQNRTRELAAQNPNVPNTAVNIPAMAQNNTYDYSSPTQAFEDSIPAYIKTLETSADKNHIREKIIEDLEEFSTDYYLDESTFLQLDKLFNFVSGVTQDPDYDLSIRTIQYMYFYHVDAYLDLYKQYHLPALKKETLKKYEAIKKAYPILKKIQRDDPVKNKFQNSWRSIKEKNKLFREPQSYLNLSNSIRAGKEIDTMAFSALINEALASPLEKNYKHLFDALVLIKKHFTTEKLSPESILLIEYAKAIIKKETDYINDKNNPLLINRKLTDIELIQAIEDTGMSEQELTEMLYFNTAEAMKSPVIHYLAKSTVNTFISQNLSENYTQQETFEAIVLYLQDRAKMPKISSYFDSVCASVLMELTEHGYYTDKKLPPFVLKLIADHQVTLAQDPLGQEIHQQQKKFMMEKISPDYAAIKVDKAHLAQLKVRIEVSIKTLKQDAHTLHHMVMPYIYNAYGFDNYPNEKIFLKIKDLCELAQKEYPNDEFIATTLKGIYEIHLAAYLELSKDETLKLPKFKKTIQQRTQILSSTLKSNSNVILGELQAAFKEGLHANGPTRPTLVLEKEIKPTVFRELIRDAQKSLLQEAYVPLVDMLRQVKKNKQSPEIIFWAQYAQNCIIEETDFFDETFQVTQSLTDQELSSAVKKSNLSTDQLAKMITINTPDPIKNQYINYIAENLVNDFFSTFPTPPTPATLVSTFNSIYTQTNRGVLQPLHSITARALAELNQTQSFTHTNFTQIAWEIIHQHEALIAKNPIEDKIYQKAKKIIIAKFSKTANDDNINPTTAAVVLVIIAVFGFFLGKKVRAKIKNVPQEATEATTQATTDRKNKSRKEDTATKAPMTTAYTAPPLVDPFPEAWDKFSLLLSLKPLAINDAKLIEKHKVFIEKDKPKWLHQNDAEKLFEFIKENIDWFITKHNDKKISIDLITTLTDNFDHPLWGNIVDLFEKKYETIEEQKRLNAFKMILLNIKKDSGFSKYEKYVTQFIAGKDISWLSLNNKANLYYFIGQYKQLKTYDENILSQLQDKYNHYESTQTVSNDNYDANTNDDDDDDDDNKMIPDSLYNVSKKTSNIPDVNITPPAAVASTASSSSTSQPSKKIEFILNPEYATFATDIKGYIRQGLMQMDNNHTPLINRAYKFLIMQFFSIIQQQNKAEYETLDATSKATLKNIRDGLCHDWSLIQNKDGLQPYLSHILTIIETTQDGSLKTLNTLFQELSNYNPPIIDLKRKWKNLNMSKEVATEKIDDLFTELEQIMLGYKNKEINELRTLALVDIFAQIGETVRYCPEVIDNNKGIADIADNFIALRNNAYHYNKPIPPGIMDKAQLDLAVLRDQFKKKFAFSC
jgi:hypothetical protein